MTVRLSERQLEVLKHTADGLTTDQAAKEMFIAPGTAKYHRREVIRKLKASSITHAVAIALREGIIE